VISPPRVQLYTGPFRVYCDPARGALLECRRIAFEEIDLSRDLERCCELEALTGGRSVPQLLVDGRPIGGFDELAALERNGGLPGSARAEWAAAPSVDP
jgi:glutaredoxin 3